MGEVTGRAQLIDASKIGARSQQVAATLPRQEIEEALRSEKLPELILDIDRRSNGDVEAHTLRVAWTDDQLKELLRDTNGDDITLFFDADEVAEALADEDIEAHGMREKGAAVLTVAAMAAGVAAAAQPAAAMRTAGGGGGAGAATTIEMVSDAATSGVRTAPELISDAGSGPGVEAAKVAAPELVSDAALTGTPSPAQSTELAASVPVSGTDSGMSGTQIAETAVGGGLVLLITAAGFALRGKRRHEQPA
jgi:hypothetical protein